MKTLLIGNIVQGEGLLQRPCQEISSSIVREMSEGVLCLDDEDVIRYCNPAAERIRKIRADKIVGRLIYAIHPAHAHPRLRELLTSLKSGIVTANKRIVKVQQRYFENTSCRPAPG